MIKYYDEVIQGSDEWHSLRCGLLTASEMKLIITPTLKIASNDKERAHMYELLAQRVTGYVEPSYVNDDMLRGQTDEVYARMEYSKSYAEVTDAGFVTNDKFGFKIGCSPDGLVGDDGMIECKSRRQKYQIETILSGEMPDDYLIQVQTSLLVTERSWCDFISYCGGLPMFTLRIFPDAEVQQAIVAAATSFEEKIASKIDLYASKLSDATRRLIPTERKVYEEIVV